jgi:hypothetical protein
VSQWFKPDYRTQLPCSEKNVVLFNGNETLADVLKLSEIIIFQIRVTGQCFFLNFVMENLIIYQDIIRVLIMKLLGVVCPE